MPGESATLGEREEQILQAVVQLYITTAEPVGSRTVVKRLGLDLSPATVRNVMADLEEAGYLQQLHTSSGRVPTDRGYRYFVDYLMRVQELTLAEQARIEREFGRQLHDTDEILRQTSHFLALTTHQTGIVKAPDDSAVEVRRIELFSVSPSRLAVLVADNYGRSHTVMAPLDEPLQGDEIVALRNFLNRHLTGVAFGQFAATVENLMRGFLEEERRLAEQALTLLSHLTARRTGQLYLEGASQLFEQPEFHDMETAREVFGLLEERDRLIELLRAGVLECALANPSVVIGSESQSLGLKEISVVASPYRVGGKAVGVLGILGPRRMPYPRLTAIVDYTAGVLSRLFTSLVD